MRPAAGPGPDRGRAGGADRGPGLYDAGGAAGPGSSSTAGRILGILIVLSLVAGVYFRLHDPGRKVYWNDEIWTSIWVSGRSSTEFEASLPRDPTTAGHLHAALFAAPEGSLFRPLAVLAREDPKQPPLYMLLARVQAGLFGHSAASLRGLSAWLGLLTLVPLFLLARELFPERITAWMAVALASVSPFQILYAQEARPYTLWMFWIAASSALLLAALRRSTGGTDSRERDGVPGGPSSRSDAGAAGGRARWTWTAYAACLALGLASHTLFLLVVAGHGLFVFTRARFPMPPAAKPWILSASAGALLYAPWALFMILQPGRVTGTTGWVVHPVGFAALFERWMYGLSSLFVDFRASASGPAVLAAVCGVAFAGCAVRGAIRRGGLAGLFLAALGLPAVALLMIPDLLLGGGGFSTPRFTIPLLIALELAAAHWVAQLRSPDRRAAVLAALVVAGAGGAALNDRADTAWTKYLNEGAPGAAAIVNASTDPVVCGRRGGLDLRRILSLCGHLGPDTRIILTEGGVAPDFMSGADNERHHHEPGDPSAAGQTPVRPTRFFYGAGPGPAGFSAVTPDGLLRRVTPE